MSDHCCDAGCCIGLDDRLADRLCPVDSLAAEHHAVAGKESIFSSPLMNLSIEFCTSFILSNSLSMLSFNFNKKKTVGVQLVKVGDKTLYEGTL